MLLKTRLKNIFEREGLDIDCSGLKNVNINGAKIGCSGIVVDRKTNRELYITTDAMPQLNGKIMYRACSGDLYNKFFGRDGINQFALESNIGSEVKRFLSLPDEMWRKVGGAC